ncbi:zinc metallopeptidase [Candidatus Venteria ishoeyi]|uniref:Putative neutral zinc metallopeptidase n=3 Tax=Candidatus Venteria ishoeyi TaxID=1899563 RepID=A0A1H6FGB6_9GAMM|nr:zinc metallopeptidase [Candidatus Venteria ishoeyi]SEH09077.1 Putative neutral zinc metallopeptidase [Candidatus Venteria ishoeyi]
MAFLVILISLLIAGIFLPQWWAQYVLRRYSKPREDFPGSGAEFARHLARQMKLDIRIETTESGEGDHYDPLNKVVRLSPENFKGNSLTAIVVASHEMGHALQDKLGYQPLHIRTQLVGIASKIERIGAGLMIAVPLVTAIFRLPAAGLLMFLAGLASLGTPVFVHLLTLPVEWDASFRRALPLLEAGGYLEKKDLRVARRILTACALTYVASSLAALLNLARWIALLRR